MEHPLEPSPTEMRAIGEAALRFVIDFIRGLPDSPASDLDGALEVARRLREAVPEEGQPIEDLLATVEEGAAKGFNTAGPGYLAFVPGGGLYTAAVAEFLACAVNRFVNVWNAAPPFAQMESTVIRWLCDLFEYPGEAGGILTSGGSMANFSAIVSARRSLLGEDFLAGTLYLSDQTHASVAKAAALAGFPMRNVRWVPSTTDLAINLSTLERMVGQDRAAGFRPFLLIANAGTTNTGRVDPIADLAALAAQEGLWLHVDAAYGGFFQLTERGRRLLRGIQAADSIILDPHKAMFLPYGTGTLLVRQRARLRDAHQVGAHYLQDLAPEDEIPNFSDYSPELSRDFRGLRVWLPLKLHGLTAFRSALDEKLDLARRLYEALRDTAGFEVPWEPDLTVVPFWYRPRSAGMDAEQFNRGLLARINASKRVFLSSTMVDGRFVLRACIVSHRTHEDRIEEAIEIIRSAASELDR
jgi:aromatic-L-amino-acid/L-tryptophan decarboxylase